MPKYTIDEWRRLKNLTQKEVCAVLGVSVPTWNKYCQEPSLLTFSQGEALAKLYGTTMECIIFLP